MTAHPPIAEALTGNEVMLNIIYVVGAILIEENHSHGSAGGSNVILARRASLLKNYPDLFEFPGGKIESNESPKQALIRELSEELKITVKESNITSFKDNTHQTKLENSDTVIHLTLFIVTNWEGILTINPQVHSEIVSVPIQSLDKFKGLIPGDAMFIPLIQDNIT